MPATAHTDGRDGGRVLLARVGLTDGNHAKILGADAASLIELEG
jgi:hypothetical protein